MLGICSKEELDEEELIEEEAAEIAPEEPELTGELWSRVCYHGRALTNAVPRSQRRRLRSEGYLSRTRSSRSARCRGCSPFFGAFLRLPLASSLLLTLFPQQRGVRIRIGTQERHWLPQASCRRARQRRRRDQGIHHQLHRRAQVRHRQRAPPSGPHRPRGPRFRLGLQWRRGRRVDDAVFACFVDGGRQDVA